MKEIGVGFHPDTRLVQYVNADGRSSFDPNLAQELNELMKRAFSFCDPYEVGLAAIQADAARRWSADP